MSLHRTAVRRTGRRAAAAEARWVKGAEALIKHARAGKARCAPKRGRCRTASSYEGVDWDKPVPPELLPPELRPAVDPDAYTPIDFCIAPKPTKLPITGAECVSEQRKRMDQVAATMALYAQVIPRVRASTNDAKQRTLLDSWLTAAETCGDEVRIYRCPKHGHAVTVGYCCHKALCPREQRRRAQRWQARLTALAKTLPNEPRGADYKRLRASGAPVNVGTFTWKMITIALKQSGTYEERLDAIVDARARLARLLTQHAGMLAGIGAIEMGDKAIRRGGRGNVHLHFLAYCGFVARDPRKASRDGFDLQSWLRAYDCTIPGCRHDADDRCDQCKREHHACTHPRSDGTARCDGSWYVDVRKAYVSEKGARYHDPEVGAIVEAVKYACAPVSADDVPRPGEAPTPSQLAHAAQVIEFFLALHGRHRVETYGLAKQPAEHEAAACDDVAGESYEPRDLEEGDDSTSKGPPKCPECDEPMKYAATGVRRGAVYGWFREAPRPRARAPA